MRRDELLKYLGLLGKELETKGLEGEVIVTGGAAMCLVHSARDATKDIDALYEPKSEINALVKSIADEYGLPQDWLNDSVKGFIGGNVETVDFMRLGNLKISAVTPEYLLAMKLMSSRVGGQDYNDIRFLLRELNIKTLEEAESVIERFFPLSRILPKTMYVLEQSLEELSSGSGVRRSFVPTVVTAVSLASLLSLPSPAAAQTTTGTFTDARDGKTYRTVTIGRQVWMAENLNYAVADGAGSWCYENDAANCSKYGRLYNWNTAMKVCPAGWRLPSGAEWDVLMTAVGGAKTAGGKLKSASGWRDNRNSTDEYGFSALPGGLRNVNGGFYGADWGGYWWSATGGDADSAQYRTMFYHLEIASKSGNGKSDGFSVRCLRE